MPAFEGASPCQCFAVDVIIKLPTTGKVIDVNQFVENEQGGGPGMLNPPPCFCLSTPVFQ